MDELEHISTKFKALQKDTPFQVPENYFEEFPEKLHAKISAAKEIPIAKKSLLIFKPYLAAAILIIVALISGTLVFRNYFEKKALQNFHAAISQAIESELYYLSDEVLFEAIGNTDINETTSYPNHSDEVIEYLMQEDFPYDEILDVF